MSAALPSLTASTASATDRRGMNSSESPDAYLTRVCLKPALASLLESVCQDHPDTLKPYLVETLCSRYPSAAESAAVDLAAAKKSVGSWVPAKKMSEKLELKRYLEDIRWGSTISGGHCTTLALRLPDHRPSSPTVPRPRTLSPTHSS